MKPARLLWLLLLLATFTHSCSEQEEPFAPAPVEEPAFPLSASNEFTFRNDTVTLANAYVRTLPYEDGRFLHTLVLSEKDVLENGDLFGDMGAAAKVVFSTDEESLVGTHVLRTARYAPQQTVQKVGFTLDHQIRLSRTPIATDLLRVGKITIREQNGIHHLVFEFAVEENYNRFNGEFLGEIVRIDAGDLTLADPADEEFTGGRTITYDGRTLEIKQAVVVYNTSIENELDRATFLVFSEEEVVVNGQLVGISDAIVIPLERMVGHVYFKIPLKTGRYQTKPIRSSRYGYFAKNFEFTSMPVSWCSNMNFEARRFNSDDTTRSDETVVRFRGQEMDVRTIGETRRGRELLINYSGPYIKATW